MALLSAGTVAYGLYANPKSGNQGCIFRDGATEGWDLHPGGDPYPGATSREILVGYLTVGDAVAYCCAYAGLRLTDTRAVEGPPDIWLKLPSATGGAERSRSSARAVRPTHRGKPHGQQGPR
jgi:hypothetical protein